MTEQTTLAILNQYPRDKYNVIAPETMTQITPWHRIIVSQVRIDPDPQHHEVYPVKGGLALHKTSLLRIADAAGVRFRPTKFKRDPDDGSYEAYATAEKQDPDGTWRQYPGSYRWDVTERLAQVKEPTSSNGIEEAKMIRKFSMQRAESGAMSRAIRAIIQLEQAYNPKDLLKPFIVARVTFNPWDDPQVKTLFTQALAARLAGNVAMLRGPDTDDPFGLDAQKETEHRATIETGNQAGEVLQLMGTTPPADDLEWTDDLFTTGEAEPEQPPPPPPTPAPTPVTNGNHQAPGAEPPARRPADLLNVVNGHLTVPYDSIHHLRGGIRKELSQPDWNWPQFKDAASWLAAYAAAMKHGKAKESEPVAAPATAGPASEPGTELDQFFPREEA